METSNKLTVTMETRNRLTVTRGEWGGGKGRKKRTRLIKKHV